MPPSAFTPLKVVNENLENKVECCLASISCCFKTFQESQTAVSTNHTFLSNYSMEKELGKDMHSEQGSRGLADAIRDHF